MRNEPKLGALSESKDYYIISDLDYSIVRIYTSKSMRVTAHVMLLEQKTFGACVNEFQKICILSQAITQGSQGQPQKTGTIRRGHTIDLPDGRKAFLKHYGAFLLTLPEGEIKEDTKMQWEWLHNIKNKPRVFTDINKAQLNALLAFELHPIHFKKIDLERENNMGPNQQTPPFGFE